MHDRERRDRGWFWLYSGLFLFGAALLAAIALRCGKALIWFQDGVKQPYTVLGYMRRVVEDLLAGRGLRMIEFTLGQGMDVLTTCTYYGYTDPLVLLGALAQGDALEWLFAGIVLLRAWLAGVAFGLYARKVGVRDGWSVACAATIYVFSGYFLRMMGRHPYFLNGALFLPLILMGIECVLEDRRWLMYTLVTALMLVVNFYFAYMNTVMAVIYIIVRLIARLPRRGVRESAKDGFILLGGYLLGAALAAVVFLPVVRLYIVNSRMGVKAGYEGPMLHYAKQWYKSIVKYAFAPWGSPGSFVALNALPMALFGVLALLGVRGGRARQVRIGICLCLAATFVPMAGYLLNGTAYVSNRWSYGLNMFVALGCALGLPAIFGKRRPIWAVVIALASAFAAVLAVWFARSEKKMLVAPAAMLGYAALLLVYHTGLLRLLDRRQLRMISTGLLAMSMAAYIAIDYLPWGHGIITEQMDRGIYAQVSSEAVGQLIGDDGIYRVAQGKYDDANSPMLGYMGTSYYWSLVDGDQSRYYQDLNLPTQSTTYHIYNLGGGVGMNAVASVKYFVQPADNHYVVPWGYEERRSLELPNGGTAAVFENTAPLALGYTYDSYITSEAYEALPVEDRLQALTQRAIVSDGAVLPEGVSQQDFSGGATEVAFQFEGQTEAEFDAHSLKGEKGGRVSFTMDCPEDGEVYVLFKGLKLTRLDWLYEGLLSLESEAGLASCNVPHPRSNFYFPKEDFAFCLGTGPLKGFDILFDNRMEYVYDEIRVVSLPLAAYEASIGARREEQLQSVVLSNNRIEGSIRCAGDRVLQIAVPYSKGWRAWIDGEEQRVFPCGGMYMGVALGAGEHTLEMRYFTPGLKAGVIVSATAALLTLVLAVVSGIARLRRRERP